jgi:hypothetical protein
VKNRIIASLAAAALLSGCAWGVKSTPGMKLYKTGDISKAIPMLEAEVAAGEVSARYPLGLAYRDGTGVAVDPLRPRYCLPALQSEEIPEQYRPCAPCLRQTSAAIRTRSFAAYGATSA